MLNLSKANVAIVGLGYVGLPLAVEFGKLRETLGFDINATRISELQVERDVTLEVNADEMRSAQHLNFTTDVGDLKGYDVYIVTVPTPIDEHKCPDLTPLISASRLVGEALSEGAIVIFESTVYPGATEEECVPVIEKASGLKLNEGFFVGYSPERINPGDKEHRLTAIVKVTSGSTPEVASFVDHLYKTIITAGTFSAPSIKVAEAAKVIENTQRDVNIALINELALIFDKLGIDTSDVLEAAGTKWNFLPFRPGLVGGHCIGVDPYYLTHRAQKAGYHPEVVLAGRRINDGMGVFVVSRLLREMILREIQIKGSKVLIMGLTFKENCPDLRNSKVVDLISECAAFGMEVDLYDPWVRDSDILHQFDIVPVTPKNNTYDAVILAVAHDVFVVQGVNTILDYCKTNNVIFDIRGVLSGNASVLRL